MDCILIVQRMQFRLAKTIISLEANLIRSPKETPLSAPDPRLFFSRKKLMTLVRSQDSKKTLALVTLNLLV